MENDPLKEQAQQEDMRRIARNFAGIAATLWIISLFLPAYGNTPGLGCLMFGWAMIFDDTFGFIAWIGNLLSGVAWLILIFAQTKGPFRLALLLGVSAVVFSFGAFTQMDVPTQNLERGPTESPDIGVFVWFISEMIVMVGAAICYTKATDRQFT